MIIVPEVNAGAASLAYAAINPVIGIGTFLAQLFLRSPLTEAGTRELRVTGTWADPKVDPGGAQGRRRRGGRRRIGSAGHRSGGRGLGGCRRRSRRRSRPASARGFRRSADTVLDPQGSLTMTKFAAIQTVSTPDVDRNLEPRRAPDRRGRAGGAHGSCCPNTSA